MGELRTLGPYAKAAPTIANFSATSRNPALQIPATKLIIKQRQFETHPQQYLDALSAFSFVAAG